MIFACASGNTLLYAWVSSSQQFVLALRGPVAYDMHPVLVQQTQGNSALLLEATFTNVSTATVSNNIYIISMLSTSDFVPR